MVDHPQGLALNEACQKLFTLIARRELCHEGHDILAWMASNLTLKHGPQMTVGPDKDTANDKIDSIVAPLMALARGIMAPDDADPHTAERGIQTIDTGGYGSPQW